MKTRSRGAVLLSIALLSWGSAACSAILGVDFDDAHLGSGDDAGPIMSSHDGAFAIDVSLDNSAADQNVPDTANFDGGLVDQFVAPPPDAFLVDSFVADTFIADTNVADDPCAANPTACEVNLVTNGGFETGTLSGWTTAGDNFVTAGTGHTGNYAAQVGSMLFGFDGSSTITQTLTVPATGTTTLTLWVKFVCMDADDEQTIAVLTTGDPLTLYDNCDPSSTAWTELTADLSPYAGMEVELYFTDQEEEDGTYFYVDDVSVLNQ